jgi:hypothetical protein
MNQTFLVTPFASLGDQTVVPIPTDPNGYVSFQQGWGPDYAADPATDANAKDIDRANTNYLFFIITQALAALQGETIPEWITAANNGGTAYSYGQGACVLYSASGNAPFTVYRSLIANNTQTPGTGNNWQVEIYQAASSTDIVAGTSNALIVTPLALTSYPGNSSQTFSVGAAITATQAAQAGQVQKAAFNYAGLAGGTANAITASISPAPTAYTDDLCVIVRVASNNPGSVSLNVNGLGTVAVIGAGHQLLQGGELVAGGFACFAYSSNFSEFILLWATGGGRQVGAATQSLQAVQLGQIPPLMRNYIAGLTLSNDGTNPNTQIDFAPGVAVDSTNTYSMSLPAVMVKTLQTSGVWTAGTGNNGLFSGAKAASTWYHCFLIRNGSTGAVDAGFDTSVTAANIPSGWTAYRRIGSVLTDASNNIRAFSQFGDEFIWTTPTLDVNATGVAVGTTNYAVTVPPGVVVKALIQGGASNSGGSITFHLNCPGFNDVASGLAPTGSSGGANLFATAGRAYVRTNTSQQIQANTSLSNTSYRFAAYGWIDYRGTAQ